MCSPVQNCIIDPFCWPFRRQAIPVIQSGQDVVAMARTGSGKTACFLLPMFEMLRSHAVNTGPRALVLTPTRELAEQVPGGREEEQSKYD